MVFVYNSLTILLHYVSSLFLLEAVIQSLSGTHRIKPATVWAAGDKKASLGKWVERYCCCFPLSYCRYDGSFNLGILSLTSDFVEIACVWERVLSLNREWRQHSFITIMTKTQLTEMRRKKIRDEGLSLRSAIIIPKGVYLWNKDQCFNPHWSL